MIQTEHFRFKKHDELWRHLFRDPAMSVYLVLDGAFELGLSKRIKEASLNEQSLYRGELSDGLDLVCPRLVECRASDMILHDLLKDFFGWPYGMFIRLSNDINFASLRRHLRKFLIVKLGGKNVYFRYYDPRVIKDTVPIMKDDQKKFILGESSEWLSSDGYSLIHEKPEPVKSNLLVFSDEQARKIDEAKLEEFATDSLKVLVQDYGESVTMDEQAVKHLIKRYFFENGIQTRKYLYELLEWNQKLGLEFQKKEDYREAGQILARTDYDEGLKMLKIRHVLSSNE